VLRSGIGQRSTVIDRTLLHSGHTHVRKAKPWEACTPDEGGRTDDDSSGCGRLSDSQGRCRRSATAFEQPLFSDAVEAWKYGPAVWSVYSQFKQYGRTPIGPSIACQPEQDEATRRWLDEVWNAFGGFTGTQLANRTHEEPPYTDAWARRRSDRSREVIPYEAMREHYVDHYEDWQPGYATAMASAYEAVDATRAKATAHTYRVSLRAVYHG
jgi:uncharacterized phage-associated protein